MWPTPRPRRGALSSLSHQLSNQLTGQLAHKVALITGASSGIGRATALLFARAGARVVVNARRQHELESLVGEIERAGGSACALAGDVQDEGLARDG